MIKELQSLSLLDILPANLLEDKKVAAAAQALDAELQAVTKATVETMHLPRLDVLPEAVVDLLAWQWHVDFYEPLGMDIETKRKLVKESLLPGIELKARQQLSRRLYRPLSIHQKSKSGTNMAESRFILKL